MTARLIWLSLLPVLHSLLFFFLFLGGIWVGGIRRDLASVHWHVDPRWISGRKPPTFRFPPWFIYWVSGEIFQPPLRLFGVWRGSRSDANLAIFPAMTCQTLLIFKRKLRCKLNIFSIIFFLSSNLASSTDPDAQGPPGPIGKNGFPVSITLSIITDAYLKNKIRVQIHTCKSKTLRWHIFVWIVLNRR